MVEVSERTRATMLLMVGVLCVLGALMSLWHMIDIWHFWVDTFHAHRLCNQFGTCRAPSSNAVWHTLLAFISSALIVILAACVGVELLKRGTSSWRSRNKAINDGRDGRR
jgi:endonuclease III